MNAKRGAATGLRVAALVLAFLAASCQDASRITRPGQEPAPPPTLATTYAAGGFYAYVTNERDDNVSVIDLSTNTVVATIPVGDGPGPVAITPDGTRAYVTNRSDNTVSVIDIGTTSVIGTPIAVGRDPAGIAITPDGAFAYVVSAFGRNGSLYVIDLAAASVVDSIPIGRVNEFVAITPDGSSAYVGGGAYDDVFVGHLLWIDIATNKVAGPPIVVGGTPRRLAITPDGTRVYVANDAGYVSVIDVATNTVIEPSIPVGSYPYGMAITPDGTRVYVVNSGANTVSVIDIATNTVIGSPIPVGTSLPGVVAITPGGTRAYVTEDYFVWVIDVATNAIVGAPIPVGGNPIGIAITPSPPPDEGIGDIEVAIAELVDAGTLTHGAANALTVTLYAALESLARGNTTAAVAQLNAFINQVQANANKGQLTDSEALVLVDAAQAAINQL